MSSSSLLMSDGFLITKLLWKYSFYGTLSLFYKETFMPEALGKILNSFEFKFTDEDFERIRLVCEKYDFKEPICNDLMLLQKIIGHEYQNIQKRNLQEWG